MIESIFLKDKSYILKRYQQMQSTLKNEALSIEDQHKNLGGTIRAWEPQKTLAKLKNLLPKFGITCGKRDGLTSINC